MLATGPSPPGASHPRSADYSSSSGALNGVNGTSPYAVTRPHPLRPNMEKEAPWSTPAASGQTGAVVPRDQQDPSTPRLGAPYPKVQWAGDWRDYRGVPEAIKPNDQSQHGYLPPPDVNSTAATVDRYLPGASSPPPANSPAVPTVSSTPSVGHANPTSSPARAVGKEHIVCSSTPLKSVPTRDTPVSAAQRHAALSPTDTEWTSSECGPTLLPTIGSTRRWFGRPLSDHSPARESNRSSV